MLDMGFLPDLKRIIRELPRERQSLFFSATMAPKITELASSLLFNPVSVNVTPKSPSVKQIEQQLIFVERKQKQKLLENILRGQDVDVPVDDRPADGVEWEVAKLVPRDHLGHGGRHLLAWVARLVGVGVHLE